MNVGDPITIRILASAIYIINILTIAIMRNIKSNMSIVYIRFYMIMQMNMFIIYIPVSEEHVYWLHPDFTWIVHRLAF